MLLAATITIAVLLLFVGLRAAHKRRPACQTCGQKLGSEPDVCGECDFYRQTGQRWGEQYRTKATEGPEVAESEAPPVCAQVTTITQE
jgi:hypothetical protein